MTKALVVSILMCLIFTGGLTAAHGLQGVPAGDQSTSCTASPATPTSQADRALGRGQFADAERLFAAMPVSEESTVGQLRAKIGQQQWKPALTLALRASGEHPQSALLMAGLAEVRFSRGEVGEALAGLSQSIKIDPCLARAHYDLSLYLNLSGMAASAQKQLDISYRLAPTDVLIRRTWKATQEKVPTLDSQIAEMQEIRSRPTETPEQRAEIDSVITALRSDKKGDCELVSDSAAATILLVPIFSDGKRMPPTGSALEVLLNGKKRQLLLDTGATGITLSREAAEGLGLVPEADVKSSGIGSDGSNVEFVAHLEHMKIGNLEFRNCKVRVRSQRRGLDIQGLFGADTLQDLLLTFDFPRQELRTAALPALKNDLSDNLSAQTIAASKRDRYVPPGMESWTPVFRESQNLMVSASIGDAPRKLFILDTGAQTGLIVSDVAREFTAVTSRPGDSLRGSSGVTNNVSAAGPITLDLPGFTGRVKEMTALDDLSGFTPDGPVRVSGFIGYDVLRNVVFRIDYRDNLVQIVSVVPAT